LSWQPSGGSEKFRRIVDLFGLSVQASTRYTNTVDHPDLTRTDTDTASHP
jgi:hypothetical protein